MNKRAFLFLLLAMLVAALGACGGAESYDKPPEILYGQDVCSNCNMIISEENYASAYWTTNGEARRFDDMGEMLAYMQSNPEERLDLGPRCEHGRMAASRGCLDRHECRSDDTHGDRHHRCCQRGRRTSPRFQPGKRDGDDLQRACGEVGVGRAHAWHGTLKKGI